LKRFLALDDSVRMAMAQSARATFLDKFEISRTVETINAALREAIRECTP